MAELPKVQAANVQRAALADVPSLRFEDLAVEARGAANVGDALDRMSQALFKSQEADVRRKAAAYAIQNPLTPEQWNDIRREDPNLDKYLKGGGKVFKETYMAAQAEQLSSELMVRLENQFDRLKKDLEVNKISEQQAVANVRDAIDGAVPVVAAMNPEVGLKFKANVAMRGSAVYEKAVQMTAKRTKANDEIVLSQFMDTIPSQVNFIIDKLQASEEPVNIKQLEAVILRDPIAFAAKHGDETTFYTPAKKAFRAAVAARLKDAVNSPAAIDNPEVIQKALQTGNFDVEVNVAGQKMRYNLQAEWNYLNDEEKKAVRQEYNEAFNSRYNILTKSREIGKLTSSQAAVQAAESLKAKFTQLDSGEPGVDENSISQFLATTTAEFSNVAKAVNSPDVMKAGGDALMVVYKELITDFVQTQKPDAVNELILGRQATGPNSKSINYIFDKSPTSVKVELRKHLRDEIKARNEFLASEDRRVEDKRRDRVNELVQIIFEKPRNSKDVREALAELKTKDSVKWTDITKSFTAGRTQDDVGTITQLQIARANGTLSTDMVLKLGRNLTVNSQEQYFGYALTTTDKENEIALTNARNKLKFTRDIAASINKTAADIEAQNAYIAVETQYTNKYLAHRKTIGTKEFKPWNATEEMDKLLAGAVKDKEVKVIQGARTRVDSFRNTYLPKDKQYTDDEIRRQIQLSISGQKSDIKTKLSPTDLNLYINDLDSLKGAR